MADNLLILQRQAHQGQPHFVPTAPLPAPAPTARDGQYQQAPSEKKITEHAGDLSNQLGVPAAEYLGREADSVPNDSNKET